MADDQRFRRLLLLVPYVLRRGGVPVEEVCRRFEITKADLIDDLNLLFMCGLPGYGPGDLIEAYVDGDEVTIKMADYFSRPLRLTASEGLLLYSGARALQAAGSPAPALEGAIKALEGALGDNVAERVWIGVDASPELDEVRRALELKRRLHIVYQSHSKDEVTERDVDPWAVFFSGGHWYLAAWCHKVGDERIFRIDRMREASVLPDSADPPDDLDLSRYENVYTQGPGAVEVHMELAPPARWVLEYYPMLSQEELPDGWTKVTLTAGGTAWLEKLLLRLGTSARKVDPPWLADRVRAAACALARRYGA